MKVAYFDCQFGASGDMLLASLIGCGLPQDKLIIELNKIALPRGSFTLAVYDTTRCSLASKKVDVICTGQTEERHLSAIAEIIEKSSISQAARKLSLRIFKRLAQAEALVHGVTIDEVHFHEVGAIDAIVDIVGFAIAYDLLEIESAYVSPLPLGSGTVKTEHGIFPVPGPAVVNLTQEAKAPTKASTINYECLTPTGAAILTTVAQRWGGPPEMDEILATCYGAGTIDSTKYPNICRLFLGTCQQVDKTVSSRFESESIIAIEANLDDFSPQAIAYTVERLFESGALDVFVMPAVMKKGRSGHLLSVICKPENQLRIAELILSETSTIGVRSHHANRLIAQREWHPVTLSLGTAVRIKVARDLLGQIVNAQPEYEDCAHYATTHGVPLKMVLAEAMAEFQKQFCYSSTMKLPMEATQKIQK